MRRIYLQKAKAQVARSNTIRDINRQIVLNYVREREPISRAEIARQTALQRSTISNLVESLIAEDFIEEIGAGISTGGRKPKLLRLKRNDAVAIGVDITPTLTTIAIADLAGHILEKEDFPTSPNSQEVYAEIISRLKKINERLDNPTIKIGVSIPGIVDQTAGIVTYVPFFEWKNWKIKEQITDELGLSVVIDNDANALALAELWFSKSEMSRIKNFITVLVADGIGTGIVFDGQVYRGQNGASGEFGHMIVGEESLIECSCGSRKCWEAFASNKAIIAKFAELTTQHNIENIEYIFSQFRAGDETAGRIIKEFIGYLGRGIANMIVGLSPETVIVSGKVTKIWTLIEKDLKEVIKTNIKQKLPETKITASTLGDNPTIMGAISLSLVGKFASTN
ncbi:xylose repressor [soil metagenome]